MSTEHADFYMGRGASAEWLGTIEWVDCSPEGIAARDVFSALNPDANPVGDDDYRRNVQELLNLIDSWPGSVAHHITAGWPHPHGHSNDTEWSYCYEKGSVYVYEFGVQVMTIMCNGARKAAEFPRFTPRKV